jgi:hypothetical protein
MRDRKEILEKIDKSHLDGTLDVKIARALLEVLFDIRDLLAEERKPNP